MAISKRTGASLVLFFVLCLGGCSAKEEHVGEDELKIEMPEISKEVFFPTKVFELIEGESGPHGTRRTTSMIYAPIRVKFHEKTEGLLTQPSLVLSFPKGGGEVDLSKYIKKDRGTFRVSFEVDEFETGEDQRIFFVSKSKKRKLEDGVYGNGCKTYYDVKDFIRTANKAEGLVVNVTRDRHDSALGGSFIFSYKKQFQTFVTQVSFVDSKRPDLFCEAVAVK
jgi:hypothetical protein